MNVNEIANKCLTGGCEYLDIQDKLIAHKGEVNLIVLIGLIFLAIIMIWLIIKENKKHFHALLKHK
ncbi:hypothetical protein HYU07_00740 [Candidatus Woesearchaeota archaeon]|nr:hypothetical protein [Candidatus Woesearchaeota archaeon]